MQVDIVLAPPKPPQTPLLHPKQAGGERLEEKLIGLDGDHGREYRVGGGTLGSRQQSALSESRRRR